VAEFLFLPSSVEIATRYLWGLGIASRAIDVIPSGRFSVDSDSLSVSSFVIASRAITIFSLLSLTS
jgi:hypothetical protein